MDRSLERDAADIDGGVGVTGSAIHSPRGVDLVLHPRGDFVSDVIRETDDFYEADILEHVAPLVGTGVVVDAGANIGNHTAFLATFSAAARIHAFEPFPANVPLLRRNVGGFHHVTIHPVALGARYGSVRMALWSSNYGHAMVDAGGDIAVEAMPLDAMELEDVTLLKVDVEGHERQVLDGARRTIDRWRPFILIEDWPGRGYALPGYSVVASWPDHQTYLYEATANDPHRDSRPAT